MGRVVTTPADNPQPATTLDQLADAFADLLGVDPELIAIERSSGRVSLTMSQAEEVLRRLRSDEATA